MYQTLNESRQEFFSIFNIPWNVSLENYTVSDICLSHIELLGVGQKVFDYVFTGIGSSINTAQSLPNHCPITAQSLPNHCPITAQSLPNHCPITAQSRPNHGPITAQSLPNHCPITAQSLPNHGPITAQSRPCRTLFSCAPPKTLKSLNP
jgi:hypothetical protein